MKAARLLALVLTLALTLALALGACSIPITPQSGGGNTLTLNYCEYVFYQRSGNAVEVSAKCVAPVGVGPFGDFTEVLLRQLLDR